MKEEIFINALKLLDIYNEELLTFLEGKVFETPEGVPFSWACFPKLNSEGQIIDVRLLVPKITDEKTLLVNIHEYTHALEYFNNLGKEYYENIIISETMACNNEQRYLDMQRKRIK